MIYFYDKDPVDLEDICRELTLIVNEVNRDLVNMKANVALTAIITRDNEELSFQLGAQRVR
jgi:hypothetical protein